MWNACRHSRRNNQVQEGAAGTRAPDQAQAALRSPWVSQAPRSSRLARILG
ncbi:hypothetical protein AZA_82285 [Nitrospirillum viridazoti Y2]|nr:hypothetical protein AZA_82285 [Nitrospirillum amazonense Y2]